MFFGKSERKRGSFVPALVVGALALVGAVSVTKKGKAVIRGVKNKMFGASCTAEAQRIGDDGE